MSDKPGNGASEVKAPKIAIQILYMEDGQIIINGPIENKLMFVALLEIAKERVFEYHRQGPTKASGIIPVRGMMQ